MRIYGKFLQLILYISIGVLILALLPLLFFVGLKMDFSHYGQSGGIPTMWYFALPGIFLGGVVFTIVKVRQSIRQKTSQYTQSSETTPPKPTGILNFITLHPGTTSQTIAEQLNIDPEEVTKQLHQHMNEGTVRQQIEENTVRLYKV